MAKRLVSFFDLVESGEWCFLFLFLKFHPLFGEMIQFDFRICFRWVGSNHQPAIQGISTEMCYDPPWDARRGRQGKGGGDPTEFYIC